MRDSGSGPFVVIAKNIRLILDSVEKDICGGI